MNIYELVIKPQGPFITSLKGDTIFGHFCWQVVYDEGLVDGGLKGFLENYQTEPAVIFSSAYLRRDIDGCVGYAFPRPALPISWLFPCEESGRRESLRKRKENKRKEWMVVDASLRIDLNATTLSGTDELEKKGFFFPVHFEQSHNSINRLTNTTGLAESGFAPFSIDAWYYPDSCELSIFVLVEHPRISIQAVKTALERIGKTGFGKEASSGAGRFGIVGAPIERTLPQWNGAKACYTLSPCVPKKESFSKAFYKPFIRFGKHGDVLARSGNPFKAPLFMADEGAIFELKGTCDPERPYIGRALTNISRAEAASVAQGYSLCLPVCGGILDNKL